MNPWTPPHHTPDRFIENTGHTALLGPFFDRFVETSRRDVPGRPWPKRTGYQQYQVGDCAHIMLEGSFTWKRATVRITDVYGLQSYRVQVMEFDGTRQCVAGVSIGDLIDLPSLYFYSIWAPEATADEGLRPESEA